MALLSGLKLEKSTFTPGDSTSLDFYTLKVARKKAEAQGGKNALLHTEVGPQLKWGKDKVSLRTSRGKQEGTSKKVLGEYVSLCLRY